MAIASRFLANKSNVFNAFISAVCLLCSGNLNAALVSMDWKTPSDGLIAYDTLKSRDWLSPRETVGLTFNYVASQIGNGGRFEGFQIANIAEVKELFIDGGWTGGWNVNYFNDPIRDAQALSIISFLGGYTSLNIGIYGLVSDTEIPSGRKYYSTLIYDPALQYSGSWAGRFAMEATESAPYIGTFLFRDATPVSAPPAYTFLVLGLCIMSTLGFNWSRKSRPALLNFKHGE